MLNIAMWAELSMNAPPNLVSRTEWGCIQFAEASDARIEMQRLIAQTVEIPFLAPMCTHNFWVLPTQRKKDLAELSRSNDSSPLMPGVSSSPSRAYVTSGTPMFLIICSHAAAVVWQIIFATGSKPLRQPTKLGFDRCDLHENCIAYYLLS